MYKCGDHGVISQISQLAGRLFRELVRFFEDIRVCINLHIDTLVYYIHHVYTGRSVTHPARVLDHVWEIHASRCVRGKHSDKLGKLSYRLKRCIFSDGCR